MQRKQIYPGIAPVPIAPAKLGAAAAWAAAIVFRRNLDAEWLLLRAAGLIAAGPATAPDSVAEWFNLLRQQPMLGLTLLNAFDLVNFALVGLIGYALYAVLQDERPTAAQLGMGLTVLGTAVYFSSNQAFTLLSLSQQYAAAGEPGRAALLAAGQAALAAHHSACFGGQGPYWSFLFVSTAGLLFSTTMLASPRFSRTAGWTGIAAHGLGLAYYVVRAAAPALVFAPLSLSAVFLLVWYIQIAVRLNRLDGTERAAWRPARPRVDQSGRSNF